MKILRKYILKEMSGMFLGSLLVFTFAMVIGNTLQMADLIINKGVNAGEVGKLFLYLIPFLLSYTIPMSALSSTLLVFGRLSFDNEITLMRASGVNLYKICLPLLTLGLLLSLVSIILNNTILPQAHFASRKIIKNIGVKTPGAYLEAGTFIKSYKDFIIFIHGIKKNKLEGIRIYQPKEGTSPRTIIAEEGEFINLENQNAIKLKLINGSSDEPNPKDPAKFYKLNFKTYYMTLALDESLDPNDQIQKKPKEMNFHQIQEEIKRLGHYHIDTPALVTEFHRKISISFASLVFILIGAGLGILTRRGEKLIQFAIALGVIVVYYLLLASAIALSLKNIGPIAFWMYLPNITLLIIGVILLRKTVES